MVSAVFAVIGWIVSLITSEIWLGVAVGFFCQVTVALVLARITHVRVRRHLEVGVPPAIAENTYAPNRWVAILLGRPLFYFLLMALVGVAASDARDVAIALAIVLLVQAVGHSVLRRRIYLGRGRPSSGSGPTP